MSKKDKSISIPVGKYTAEARSGGCLTARQLRDFQVSPLLYKLKLSGEVTEPDTPAMRLGRVAHCLLIGGQEAFDEKFAVDDGPTNLRTGRPYGRATETYAVWRRTQDREIVSTADFALLSRLRDSVWNHPIATELLRSGCREVEARAMCAEEECISTIDVISDAYGIADFKTCDSIDRFELDAQRLGYVYQLAFHRAVLRECFGKNHGCWLIGAEKRTPFRSGVWRISDAVLERAEAENIAAIHRLQECRRTDTWPTGYEELRTITQL